MIVSIPFKRESVSKDGQRLFVHRTTYRVSIPFKRESVSKVSDDSGSEEEYENPFQFPSNGKAYPKEFEDVNGKRVFFQFQFPSNGKAYPKKTVKGVAQTCWWRVSIPFKRESVSKGPRKRQSVRRVRFQFPSNGKAYPKWGASASGASCVSFQFPSNGKAYPKLCHKMIYGTRPRGCFNSLQTGKRIQSRSRLVFQNVRYENWFQFPSNGKAYPKEIHRGIRGGECPPFQFPSNGKAYPKLVIVMVEGRPRKTVSIPFKRESVSKETLF